MAKLNLAQVGVALEQRRRGAPLERHLHVPQRAQLVDRMMHKRVVREGKRRAGLERTPAEVRVLRHRQRVAAVEASELFEQRTRIKDVGGLKRRPRLLHEERARERGLTTSRVRGRAAHDHATGRGACLLDQKGQHGTFHLPSNHATT